MGILSLYTLLLRIILKLIKPFSPYLKRKFRRVADGYDDYFGRISPSFSKEGYVWIHAVSVGEAKCGKIFMDHLKELGFTDFFFTTTCEEAFDYISNFDGEIKVAYFPIDLLEHYIELGKRINILSIFIMEVDIWPNFVRWARQSGIPIFLINGRISHKTMGFYMKFSSLAKYVFGSLNLLLVQTEKDRELLIELGSDRNRVISCGNMKFDEFSRSVRLSDEDREKIGELEKDQRCPIIIGGSTHRGEEEFLLNLWLLLVKKKYNPLLIIAPRDIKRCDEIRRLISQNRISSTFWSSYSGEKSDIILIDTFGILSSIYKAVDFIFIGGSMGKIGGHSIIEAIIAGKPVITGMDMRNFADITELIMERGNGLMTESVDEAAEYIDRIIKDDEFKDIEKGQMVVLRENVGATKRMLEIIREHGYLKRTDME